MPLQKVNAEGSAHMKEFALLSLGTNDSTRFTCRVYFASNANIRARGQESPLNSNSYWVGEGVVQKVPTLTLTGNNFCQTLRLYLELNSLETIWHCI